VAITLVGETTKVTRAGGIVEHALLNLPIHGKPADIPASIEVDVEQLEVGMAIRVSDLKLPVGVTADVDPETPVVVAAAPHGVDTTLGAESESTEESEATTETEATEESSDES
jgi:large subunit ribosomal protein L25